MFRHNKGLILIFSFCICTHFLYATVLPAKVISPKPGVYGNLQPLIIEKDINSEVYYSLKETDPLVSGFAYDGSIMIGGSGKNTIKLVTVTKDGVSDIQVIEWIVNPGIVHNFIPNPSTDGCIHLKENQVIKIPASQTWYSGDIPNNVSLDNAFCIGGELSIDSRCNYQRYIPIVLVSGNLLYRYVLLTGTESKTEKNQRSILPDPYENEIVIENWTNLSFSGNDNYLCSIDKGSWKKVDGVIYLDRTREHEVSWRKIPQIEEIDSDFSQLDTKTIVLPAKPCLLGLPDKKFTNSMITLELSDKSYLMSYKAKDGSLLIPDKLIIDTVMGDSFGFSETFTVYYQGIKQGNIESKFILNKRPPKTPNFITNDISSFSRKDVTIQFKTGYPVYCCVPEPYVTEKGFDSAKVDNNSYPIPKEEVYTRIKDNKLVLKADPEKALFYTVFAYIEDDIGNKSNRITYRTIIDSSNFYVIDGDNNTGDGSISRPYTSLRTALNGIKENNNPKLYVNGVFRNVSDLVINKNCRILGLNDARIIFNSEAGIKITNSTISIENCTLEKKENSKDVDIYQKNFINIDNSTLIINNCELLCSFKNSGVGINSIKSNINFLNTGIAVKAGMYSAIISSVNSKINLLSSRFISSAKTAVGISSEKCDYHLKESDFRILGSLNRAGEFSNSTISMIKCNFISQNSLTKKTAIWYDRSSKIVEDNLNNITGFSTLSEKEE